MSKMTSQNLDCDGRRCHAECELRHLDRYEKEVRGQCEPKLVICAGPERSGSTWLYNATRLLFSAAKVPCDSYWMHSLTEEKLRQRLSEGRVVVCKTHEWNDSYKKLLVSLNPTVLLTHRDLRGVLGSYRRMGWAYSLPRSYADDHMMWRQHCSLDLGFEEFVKDGESALRKLADHLKLDLSDEDIKVVNKRISDLRGNGGVNQISKLWPSHISQKVGGGDPKVNDISDEALKRQLLSRFKDFMELYGYK